HGQRRPLGVFAVHEPRRCPPTRARIDTMPACHGLKLAATSLPAGALAVETTTLLEKRGPPAPGDGPGGAVQTILTTRRSLAPDALRATMVTRSDAGLPLGAR